jgi:hypothetical protein
MQPSTTIFWKKIEKSPLPRSQDKYTFCLYKKNVHYQGCKVVLFLPLHTHRTSFEKLKSKVPSLEPRGKENRQNDAQEKVGLLDKVDFQGLGEPRHN